MANRRATVALVIVALLLHGLVIPVELIWKVA